MFSGVLGGGRGPGDVSRSMSAGSVSGVGRGRDVVDAAHGLVTGFWEVELSFLSMNRLNSYFAGRILISKSQGRE